jgi:hypothetical protein
MGITLVLLGECQEELQSINNTKSRRGKNHASSINEHTIESDH